jgi:hypothetical protein
MGQFNGNVICTEPANSLIVFRHMLMEEYGLAAINIPSIQALAEGGQIGYQKLLNIQGYVQQINNFVAAGLPVDPFPWLAANWNGGDWRYWQSGEEGYSQTQVNVTEIRNLMRFWDKTREDQEADSNKFTYRNRIAKIQHSKDNCLRTASSYETSPFAVNVMGYSFLYHLEIYFLNPSIHQDNSRVLARKTDNLVTGIPRRNSGATFSPGRSAKESTGVFKGDGITDSKDAQDQAVGPMLTVWNENLGGYQSPSPFLSRLLEDIPSAEIPLITLDTTNTTNRNPEEFFEGINKSSQATHGMATPLNVHGGDPNQFGPNFTKCDTTDVEKIQATNRSNVNFTQGEVVLTYPIDGEFIIQKYSPLTEEVVPFQQGRTAFYQFIATSDELFRPLVIADDDEKVNKSYVLPNDFLNMVRYRYYSTSDLENKVIELPEWQKTAKINPYCQLRYYQIPQPDGSGMINTFTNPDGPAIGTGGISSDIPLWWGPVFVEGVTANTQWKSTNKGVRINAYTYEEQAEEDLPDIDSFDGLNFPAMQAFNGPYGKGHPDENTYSFIKKFNEAVDGGERTYFGGAPNPSTYVAISGSNGLSKFTPAYDLAAANPNNICFQLCQAEYVGAVDDATTNSALSNDAPGAMYDSTAMRCRRLQENATVEWNAKSPTVSFETLQEKIRSAITYRQVYFGDGYGNIDFSARVSRDVGGNTTGSHYFYNKDGGGSTGVCFPYDVYTKWKALNRPRDTNEPWGGDGALSATMSSQTYITSRVGSNTVGISVMRRKFSGGGKSGATISTDVVGLYGVRGRSFGMAPSTSYSANIIGAIMASITSTTTADTRGLTSGFGSTTGDSYYGFGSAGIFVRVYDGWPDQDTVAVPQYYTLLHFNPSTFYGVNDDNELKTLFPPLSPDVGNIRSGVNQTLKEVRFYTSIDEYEDKTIAIDIPDPDMPDWIEERASTHYLDFREPVYASYLDVPDPEDATKNVRLRAEGDEDGNSVLSGTFITSGTYLRPMDEWKLNIDRRGALVSETGYTYSQLHIGAASDDSSIVSSGNNFKQDDTFTLRNNIKIKIEEVEDGGVTGWSFYNTDITTSNGTLRGIDERGTGFLPSDFPFTMTFAADGGGEFCEIKIEKGISYKRLGNDIGPKSLAGPTRLTLGSGEGKTWVEGARSSSIAVAPTEGIRYLGQYEAVFFTQNDIGMATFNEQNSTSGTPRLQFFQLNIA